MTTFGIYFIVYYVLNLASTFYYLGKGEMVATRGALAFSAVWLILNLVGLLWLGTGTGVF